MSLEFKRFRLLQESRHCGLIEPEKHPLSILAEEPGRSELASPKACLTHSYPNNGPTSAQTRKLGATDFLCLSHLSSVVFPTVAEHVPNKGIYAQPVYSA